MVRFLRPHSRPLRQRQSATVAGRGLKFAGVELLGRRTRPEARIDVDIAPRRRNTPYDPDTRAHRIARLAQMRAPKGAGRPGDRTDLGGSDEGVAGISPFIRAFRVWGAWSPLHLPSRWRTSRSWCYTPRRGDVRGRRQAMKRYSSSPSKSSACSLARANHAIGGAARPDRQGVRSASRETLRCRESH